MIIKVTLAVTLALFALIVAAFITLPDVGTYDAPQNAGIYIGCHGFEYRGDVGPFHNCG